MSLASFYKEKVVIITGASRGIGKELARQCIEMRARVVITSRSIESLQEVVKDLNIPEDRVLLHAGDVTDDKSNRILVAKTLEKFGRLDVLINNAGITAYGSIDDIYLGVYEQVLDINVNGSIAVSKSCISALKESRGSILFISSIAGFVGLPGHSAYSTSKMALTSIAHALHIELHSNGVFVGICYVGFTKNSQQKSVLSPKGHPEAIPERPAFLTASRDKTAKRILRQIAKKRYYSNHSPLGVLVMAMTKLFPGAVRIIMRNRYTE